MAADTRPLVLHVVHRFDTGGLENGLANLINHMPERDYRHAIVALTEVTEFRRRVQRDDVAFISLHKPPGHGARLYAPFWRRLRELRPAVVHTRNLGPLEMQVAAAFARVPLRVHGEHGRELNDLDGSSRKFQRLRRLYAPFVQHYVALSRDLERYLVSAVGISRSRVTQIYNGVDCARFRPAPAARTSIDGCPFAGEGAWIVGTVGRMQGVKHPTLLAHAFVRALAMRPQLRSRLRLVMIGDGPLRDECRSILDGAGLSALAWLPGERHDVAEVMRTLNCFVLPSLAEGISNTILEAMSSACPVIATDVGGNAELVDHGRSGLLVQPDDPLALAQALLALADDPDRAAAMGARGRQAVEQRFSLDAMVAAYRSLYDRHLAAVGYPMRSA